MMDKNTTYRDLLQQLRQREGLLRILIFTVFTAFCWVGFSIFLSQQKTKIPPLVQKYAIPLNPNIDRITIEDIKSRRFFSDQDLERFPIYYVTTDEAGNSSIIQLGTETIATASSVAPSPTPASTPVASTSSASVATNSSEISQ